MLRRRRRAVHGTRWVWEVAPPDPLLMMLLPLRDGRWCHRRILRTEASTVVAVGGRRGDFETSKTLRTTTRGRSLRAVRRGSRLRGRPRGSLIRVAGSVERAAVDCRRERADSPSHRTEMKRQEPRYHDELIRSLALTACVGLVMAGVARRAAPGRRTARGRAANQAALIPLKYSTCGRLRAGPGEKALELKEAQYPDSSAG